MRRLHPRSRDDDARDSRWRRVTRSTWPRTLSSLTFVALTLIAVRAATAAADGEFVYALDDAYIHMAMAKNFAAHGVWGCTPFHFSSSSSSPLWTLILAVVYFVTGVHEMTALILNLVFGVATFVAADHYLSRFAVPAPLRAVALITLLVVTSMPAMALMGMEHVLHLCLTIGFAGAALDLLLRERRGARPTRETVVVCVLAALLAASRYEGLFLIGLACLTFLLRRDARGLLIGVSAAAPVAIVGTISMVNGAYFLPNSLMLKAAGESASPFTALLKPFTSEDLAFYQNNPGLVVLLVAGIMIAIVQAAGGRSWRAQLVLPIWLTGMVFLHGHFVFSPTFWAYRYDAYLFGFAVFAVTIGSLVPRERLAPFVAIAAIVGCAPDVRSAIFPEAEIARSRNTLLEHAEAARFINAYYGADSIVANDIGAVTFFTNARILDLVGLGDVEPIRIMQETGRYTRDDVFSWTAAYRPSIALVQLDWSLVAPRIPQQWTKAAEVNVPPYGQRIGFYAIDPAVAGLLRANVQYHYGTLRAAAGYHVTLF